MRGEIQIKVEKVLNIHKLPKFQLGNLGTWSAGFNIDTTVPMSSKKAAKKGLKTLIRKFIFWKKSHKLPKFQKGEDQDLT